LARDHFWVETEAGEPERAWPEDIVHVFGETPPDRPGVQSSFTGLRPVMEPNQALAQANRQFPPAARLHKTGYRLDQHILLLTFDFPDLARERYAGLIASLEADTGWKVEVFPEPNQSALFALAQEVLPPAWRIVKGPALYRQEHRVAIAASGPPEGAQRDLVEARQRFQSESGFMLAVSIAITSHPVAPVSNKLASTPLEINAAYAAIRAALEGSTLYRTSLKGEEIVLSFISPQVGERYRETIDALARQVGWPLSINPQPNQGAILEAARVLMAGKGIAILKGPSVYPDRSEVVVSAAGVPEEEMQAEIALEFEERTGYRLTMKAGASPAPTQNAPAERVAPSEDVVMIPVARILLRRFYQNVVLDPEKVEKAVERIRRLGQVSPPVQLRRLEDGYLLMDGMYRLRAARELGLEQIPAIIVS
ncbi:MAG: ParB/RepB/Spo0J family partition protein, partial [Omnitrophica WOR_2 bacterium]